MLLEAPFTFVVQQVYNKSLLYNTNTLFPKIGALSSIHKSTYIYKHQMNYILCL